VGVTSTPATTNGSDDGVLDDDEAATLVDDVLAIDDADGVDVFDEGEPFIVLLFATSCITTNGVVVECPVVDCDDVDVLECPFDDANDDDDGGDTTDARPVIVDAVDGEAEEALTGLLVGATITDMDRVDGDDFTSISAGIALSSIRYRLHFGRHIQIRLHILNFCWTCIVEH